ncbi:hypothetical protein [Novosphingopyxis sp.]|uniref:hypothetical protein n=1 Tax=Novosphingopyxis sp. TaxID=2709690 RepID=UPI003B58BF06
MDGTSAELPAGAAMNGFIDEDVELATTATGPASMTVPALVAPMQVVIETTAEAVLNYGMQLQFPESRDEFPLLMLEQTLNM